MFSLSFWEHPLIVWSLLAGGGALAAFAALKGGRGAVIGVFCAVWSILCSLSLMRLSVADFTRTCLEAA